jgi:hypothetical protein
MKKLSLSLIASAMLASGIAPTLAEEASAQNKEEKGYDVENWDVNNPPYALNEVAISTNETTWSSLDVAPNGKFMVFDMLGDLYKVDIDGGDASPLTQDFAWNIHPSISPDGKHVFQTAMA